LTPVQIHLYSSLSLSLANLRRTGKQIEESGLVPQLVVTGYPFLAASATCVDVFDRLKLL
jgi:hypothetical protein